MSSSENRCFCETRSLYKGIKELWLFTSVNTQGLKSQCDRSKVLCCPFSGPRGGQAPGLQDRNVALPGGFMSPTVCLSCSFLGGGRNPSSAGVGDRWSTALAGMTLVLPKPTDSLDSYFKNLNSADFTYKEISLMPSRNEKENEKAVSFGFLLNLLEKSGTPCISLFEEVLASEI